MPCLLQHGHSLSGLSPTQQSVSALLHEGHTSLSSVDRVNIICTKLLDSDHLSQLGTGSTCVVCVALHDVALSSCEKWTDLSRLPSVSLVCIQSVLRPQSYKKGLSTQYTGLPCTQQCHMQRIPLLVHTLPHGNTHSGGQKK